MMRMKMMMLILTIWEMGKLSYLFTLPRPMIVLNGGFTPRSAYTLAAVRCSCSRREATLAEADSGVTLALPHPLAEILPSILAAKASRQPCRGPLTVLAPVLTCQCGVGPGSQGQTEVCFEAGTDSIVPGI